MKAITRFTAAIAAIVAIVGFTTPASAEFSAKTFQAKPGVVIAAVKDAAGNATISWDSGEAVEFTDAEHYIGANRATGRVYPIANIQGKSMVLRDVGKNGGYFNLKTKTSGFLHIECGGDTTTTMPTLKGIKPNCDEVDKATGQRVGRLVVE